jgi:hypothetical protein
MPASGARGRPAQSEDGDITQNPDSSEDDLLHLLHVSCTFAASAAKNENTNPASVYGIDEVSSCVQEDRSLFAANPENEGRSVDRAGVSLPLSHVPDSCSKHDRNVVDIAGIGDLDPEPAPSVCCSLQQTAGNVQQITSPAANNQEQEPAAALDISSLPEVAPARRASSP